MALEIRIYTLSTCSHCKAAKEFLNECGASYDCIELDLLAGEERVDRLNEVIRYNPSISFPTILVGDEVIVGFQEQRLREVLEL
ncbi:Glutaredoxin [Syntrophus gentianae]|uniref:Glutaredoxin n=1 Tax=Syntrophus gentianae TaxID=43775 RepID=A0A1H7XBR9_9BACT|nr:glutaredoxin family protein [Syntrophus gentianae]SEM31141.1 Glutaredoxin [Syntrophus gentianae]